MLLLLATAFGLECPQPTSLEDLDGALDQVETALGDLDDTGAKNAMVALTGAVLPCLGEVVPAEQSARLHRVMGLHLFGLGETAGAVASASAGRALQPEVDYAVELLPESHPLRLESPERKTRKIPEPRDGYFSFDGAVGRGRPKALPSLAQRLDSAGVPTWSAYVNSREPLVPYRAIPRRRNVLLVCGGASLAAAGGLFAGSWSTKSGLAKAARDPSSTREDLLSRAGRANTLQALSLVSLGIGVGCTTGAALETLR